MPINVGSTAIDKVYVGTQVAAKVYLGTTEVWSNVGPVTYVMHSVASAATIGGLTGDLPTGTATGDRVFAYLASTGDCTGTPSGWTQVCLNTRVGPNATPTNLNGWRNISCSYRDYDGSWSVPSWNTSTSGGVGAVKILWLISLRRDLITDTWDTPTLSSVGNDLSRDKSFSATTSSGFTTHGHGYGIGMVAINNSDVTSVGSISIAHAGGSNLTGTVNGLTQAGGNGCRSMIARVTDPTPGSGAITFAGAANAACEGGVVFVEQTASR